jgi:muramoyltetrapeptide carboxypeptidase
LAPGLWKRKGYLAGDDATRAEQIAWALGEEEIRGIFCLRGGYGAMRLLPSLAVERLGASPKVFVGFSDLTALLVHFLQDRRWVVFHGPSLISRALASGGDSTTARALREAVMEGAAPGPILGEGWAPGKAEGPLVGGCLSLLSALAGTPYAPRLHGAILFLEDVNEPLYRLDRMLLQLRLAGLLDGVRGVVVGEMVGIRGAARPAALREALLEGLGFPAVPVVAGVASGHGGVNLTLPLGCRVTLDGDAGRLLFQEPGVW